MAQRVGRAVDAGRLAVPHGQHAVEARAGQVAGELAAPGGGRAELLVEAGTGDDVVAARTASRWRCELLVEAAERRALVAGDERAGVQAAARVGAVLVEREPDERLDAR